MSRVKNDWIWIKDLDTVQYSFSICLQWRPRLPNNSQWGPILEGQEGQARTDARSSRHHNERSEHLHDIADSESRNAPLPHMCRGTCNAVGCPVAGFGHEA